MSSAGHIMDMINTIKRNRIPVRERKLGHKEYVEGVPVGKPLRFKKKMTAAEFNKFKEKLATEKQEKTRLMLIIFGCSLLVVSTTIWFYLS